MDILEQLNITFSESETASSDQNTENEDQSQKYQSQKEIEIFKSSLNNISYKNDNGYRKQSIFATNKQSIKDLEDQQKEGDSNTASFQEQSIDKLNLNGLEIFKQNSLTVMNENQKVTFKDIDKVNKELSEERLDSQNTIKQNRKQPYQGSRKSIKNVSQKFIPRLSCFQDNSDNNSKENLKSQLNKLMDNFKLLNQTISNSNKNRKYSTFYFNPVQEVQENSYKPQKYNQSQMMLYDFDLLRDFQYYFPLGNSKEILLKQKNQIKKKFRRTNVSFLFQNKL